MQNDCDTKEFELLCVIVDFDLGSKVIKIAKRNGVSGGTVFLGYGTIKNKILEALALTDIRKEIVIIIDQKNTAYQALEEINKKFTFNKPNHGIAFSASVSAILGSKSCQKNYINKERGVTNTMYNAIFSIVDKGNAEAVIEAATKAGARGGTIINARGSGIHETSKLFSMDIEPEKEIVLILSENNLTDKITTFIKEQLDMDKPGNGIIFVLDASKTYGLY